MGWVRSAALAALLLASTAVARAESPPLTLDQILAAAPKDAWRDLAPDRLMVMQLPSGRVVIELAPRFAPNHVRNVQRLIQARFYDGLSIVRVQDDYVTQWGDADSKHPTGEGRLRLPAEFDRPLLQSDPFTPLGDADAYAPATGFTDGMPTARDPRAGRVWLTHCYGMVGAGRDMSPDSGGGPELYVVIGHAPRQLDRNVTLVGRVVEGMDKLSALPRGDGPMGFYTSDAQKIRIQSVRLASELPTTEQPRLQALRTETATFARLVESRRNRRDPWYVRPAGHIDVCNAPLPVRAAP